MAAVNHDLHTWGFFEDDSSDPDTCTQIGSDDSTSEVWDADTNLMVRLGLDETSNKVYSGTFKLQARVGSGGTWFDVTTGSGASGVKMVAGTPTDGALCNTQLLASGAAGAWEDGEYDESGTTGSQSDAKYAFSEYQWCVQLVGASLTDGDIIYFRQVSGNGTDSYGSDPTGLPQIEVNIPTPTSDFACGMIFVK